MLDWGVGVELWHIPGPRFSFFLGKSLSRDVKEQYMNLWRIPVGSVVKKNQSSKAPVVEGRRIVDIQHVAQQLHCLACKRDIFLRDIVKEVCHGFGSVFYTECSHQDCKYTTKITTGTHHGRVFDVNMKLATVKCSNLCLNMHTSLHAILVNGWHTIDNNWWLYFIGYMYICCIIHILIF